MHTRERQMRAAQTEVLLVRIRLAAHRHRWEEAEQAVGEVLQLARVAPFPYDEAKVLFIAGQVSLQQGHANAAYQQFAEALRLLRQLGERPYAGQVEQALASLEVAREDEQRSP